MLHPSQRPPSHLAVFNLPPQGPKLFGTLSKRRPSWPWSRSTPPQRKHSCARDPTAPEPLPAHRTAVPTTGRLRSPVTTHAPRPDAAIWRAVSLGRRSSPRNLRNFCLRDAETSLSPRARLRAPVPCVLQTARLHAVPVAWRVARPRRFVCLHDCRPAAAGAASRPHALGTRRECGSLRGAGRRPPPRHGNCDALQTSVLLVCLGRPKG